MRHLLTAAVLCAALAAPMLARAADQIGYQIGNGNTNTQAVDPNHPLPTTPGVGPSYKLLTNASATGAAMAGVVGGSYVWCVSGTFNGATVALNALGPDGTTYLPVATRTTAGCTGVVLGSNASVQAVVTGGPPSALYSTLS